MKKTHLLQIVCVVFLTFVSFLFRIRGLQASHPFWVDEFSTTSQAQLLLRHGANVFSVPTQYFEYHNITTHLLVAVFFKFFGHSEFIARLPFVLIGALIPVSLFYLGRKVFNSETGLVAALFSTFSYFMIAWSRQARGYPLQQLLTILFFLLYLHLLETKNNKVLFAALFSVIILLGILTHTMFLLALAAVIFHYILYNYKKVKQTVLQPLFFIFSFIFVGLTLYSGLLSRVGNQFSALVQGQIYNNVWFYHSFLWREYGLISFLAVVGLVSAFFVYRKSSSLLTVFTALHLIFVCFLFGPYVTRYLLPIFPILFLYAAFTITHFTRLFIDAQKDFTYSSYLKITIPLAIVVGIIINGYSFSIKPKAFYSVNHQSREIALVDYHQVYAIIKEKGMLENNQTAVIDTWSDRIEWYLGSDFEGAYTFRWMDAAGLMKSTPFTHNQQQEKVLVDHNHMKFIGELSDLQLAMRKYPKGFIWIDDATLPEDVVEFVKKNFHQELYLDHYTLDDNPYSIWPGTLYSWGLEK